MSRREPRAWLWLLFGFAGLFALWRWLLATPPRDTASAAPPPAGDPADIPARGWREILKRTASEFSSDRVMAVAAGVTFYGLLAIFPALAALVSLYGLFADPGQVGGQLSNLSGIVPGGATNLIGEEMKRMAGRGGGSLGIGFIIGLAVALWSASSGMRALFDALNVAYGTVEERSFVRLAGLGLLFTVATLVFLGVAAGVVVVLPIAFAYVGAGGSTATVISIGRWPALFVLMALGLAVLYRYGPSRRAPRWHWISWGSATAAALWVGGSALFSWYVANFGSYDKTYGSLGAVIGFMTWLWLSATIVLLGAELNAEIENQGGRATP